MSYKTELLLQIVGCIVFIIACIWGIKYLFNILQNDKKKLIEASKPILADYKKAIANGDRAKALELGRKYYSTLRGGKLTIYDEQAIANDLSSIK